MTAFYRSESLCRGPRVVQPRPTMSAQTRGTRIFPRWFVAIVIVGAVLGVLYALRNVLAPVFLALIIAYVLDPVIDWFERRRVPRSAAIVIVLTIVLGVLASFLLIAVPALARDIVRFAQELPGLVERAIAGLRPLFERFGISPPQSIEDVMAQLELDGSALAQQAVAPAGVALRWVLGGTMNVLAAIAGAVIIPVFAFYLLLDFDRITTSARDLVPPNWRPYVVDAATEVDKVLGEFMRGQLIVMVMLAVMYSIAYSLAGVRLALLIGLVGGLLSFIPYVGAALGLGLAILMSLLDWNGSMQLVWVFVGHSIVQGLESFVITPRIVGEKVGLSPIWVLFALMVGGEVFGFLGILLALPVAAVAKIFTVRAVAWYRRSPLFLDARPPDRLMPGLAAILREEGLPDRPDIAAQKQQVDAGVDAGPAAGPAEPPPRDTSDV